MKVTYAECLSYGGCVPMKYYAHPSVSVVALVLTLLMVCVGAQARIAFTSRRDGNSEIYVMDADGKNQRNLANNRDDDWWPSWPPDGKRIVFVSERDGNSEIYVMDADGGNQRRLTNNPHGDGGPAWFGPAFAVAPAGKTLTIWGWLKQVDR